MIKWYTSTSDLSDVITFCKNAKNDSRPAAENMRLENYQERSHCLMHKLIVQKEYDTGGYGLLYRNKEAVTGGGFYQTKWHDQLYMSGVRSYTIPGIKQGLNYLQGELWHAQLDKITELGGKVAMSSYNDYNAYLIDTLIKINDPANWKTSFCENGLWYRKPGRRITPMRKISHPVTYNYTKQWIMYCLIDPDFDAEFQDICLAYKCDA